MAQVMNPATDSLTKSPQTSDAGDDDLPPVPAPPPPSQTLLRRREREPRDRRDDRDLDRPPNRRDYVNRTSPLPPLRERDRDYKRRRSPSSPPFRERRYPSPYSKRSRRGSPRGGYGHDDRSDSDFLSSVFNFLNCLLLFFC